MLGMKLVNGLHRLTNMKYRFGAHLHEAFREIYPTLRVEPPYAELSIVGSIDDFDDLDDFIEYIRELMKKNVPDFSEHGVIIYQGIFFGSKKSKIVELVRDAPAIEKEEFFTAHLLKLAMDWRKFLLENKEGKGKRSQ
jgi:hypothetical protein